jgi:hypothetical protein
MNVTHAQRLLDKSMKRMRFYEKCKAALEAGYYIIPPFDIQLFALRVNRAPNRDVGESRWVGHDKVQALPMGDGRYVNAARDRVAISTEQRPIGDNKTREVTLLRDAGLARRNRHAGARDEADHHRRGGPRARTQDLRRAGHRAGLPRSRPDHRWPDSRPDGKGVLTFFVAWWLDEEDL